MEKTIHWKVLRSTSEPKECNDVEKSWKKYFTFSNLQRSFEEFTFQRLQVNTKCRNLNLYFDSQLNSPFCSD